MERRVGGGEEEERRCGGGEEAEPRRSKFSRLISATRDARKHNDIEFSRILISMSIKKFIILTQPFPKLIFKLLSKDFPS